ncbi:hypothetical protein V7S57_21025 [Caulobacter sp. CCNWLY153]|uniref:hypothetical protein n=1 Tax=unclassified Caulobacter TaxID=2648921 RepID=UPI002FF11E77
MLKKIVGVIKEFAWPFGLTGGIYGYATRFVPAEWQVSVWITGAISAILISLIISLLWHLSQRDSKPVVSIKIDQVLNSGRSLLTEPNDHIGFDMAARAYYKDGNHELLLGTCIVTNVQADKRSLMEISYDPDINTEIALKLSENNDGVRGRVFLRPGIIIKE